VLRNRVIGLAILLGMSYGSPLHSVGILEGRLAYDLDSLSSSAGNFVHIERLVWGVQGAHKALWNLNYELTGGGVLKGNSAGANTSFVPEYGFRTSLKPTAAMDVALFSYARLRNPLQVYTDSLELKEFVHGIRFGVQLAGGGRLGIATGLSSQQIEHRDSVSTTRQFLQLNLDQHLAGMQFRLGLETDNWSRDTLDAEHQTRTTLQWYGSPIRGLRWSAANVFYLKNGDDFWRSSQRMNYDLTQRQHLWASYFRGAVAYGSRTLNQSNYDLRYRFQWRPSLGFDLMFKGNRVVVPDSLDVFHWRSYGFSAFWDKRGAGFVRGNLDAGFKESYRYGKGLDLLLATSEFRPVFRSSFVELQLSDDLSAEVFQRFDATADSRYDIRHQLNLTAALLPGGRYSFGNQLKLHNHFGSDLDFSPDTLRNAVIDELYFKYFRQGTHVSIYYRTVLDMRDPDSDLQFYFNTRWFHKLSGNTSLKLTSLYRFHSDIYADYLWLNAAFTFQAARFSYALELQSRGLPNELLDQNTSIWLRFVRHL